MKGNISKTLDRMLRTPSARKLLHQAIEDIHSGKEAFVEFEGTRYKVKRANDL